MTVAVQMHEWQVGHRDVTRGVAARAPRANCGGLGSVPTSRSRIAYRDCDMAVPATTIV